MTDIKQKIENRIRPIIDEIFVESSIEHNLKTGDISPKQETEISDYIEDFASDMSELIQHFIKQNTYEPELCYVAVLDDKGTWTAGIVKKGETGYYLTDWDWGETKEKAELLVKELNQKLGINEREALIMVIKSMRNNGVQNE